MGLEVIGAGLGRTGTASLKVALEQLGFGRCYHFGEVLATLPHMEQWLLAAGGNPDWERIFKGYGAAVDYPACNFWEELSVAYPEAKVILTVRDANDWFDSVHATILSPSLVNYTSRSPHGEFYEKTVLRDFGDQVNDRDFMVQYFEQRNAVIRQAIPEQRLLVYEVRQGWEPLCDFLGLPIPEEKYPRVNSREETERMLGTIIATDPSKGLDEELVLEASKQLYSESTDKG